MKTPLSLPPLRTSVEAPLHYPLKKLLRRSFATLASVSLLALVTTATLVPTVGRAALDTVKPGVTVSSPSAAALSITGTPGGTLNVTGTATDNIGVDHVSVTLNGGAPALATLNSAGALSSPYAFTLHPVGGANTLRVQSFDTTGNPSVIVTRSFTYVVKVALTVNTSGPGTVTGKMAGAVYQVGKAYVLTAVRNGPGSTNIFDGWTGDGLTPAAKVLPRLSFVFSDALALNPVVTAAFIVNPFTVAATGSFNGLVSATTPPATNENSGFINLNVTTAGSFTGTLKIDARSLVLAGQFDNTGHAVFGPGRTSTVTVVRTGKASLVLGAVTLDFTPSGTHQITGTIGQQNRDTVIPMSTLVADRAAFSLGSPVPPQYKGYYTVVIPAQAQTNGLTSPDFPQGDGIGSLTVTAAGLVTLSATLADGTAVTASAPLSATRTCPLFAQIYLSKSGSFGGLITLNDGLADHDLLGTGFLWFKPYLGGQTYPYGWPEGVSTIPFGAKYASIPGTSVLPGVSAVGIQVHNALLAFQQGGLTHDVTKVLHLSPLNVVTRFGIPADPSYSLALTAATGKFGGTFAHTDGTRPAFSGVICQKGPQGGGYGYFLAPTVKIIGGGQSGHVSLKASKGPLPVALGLAGDFVILSKSGITDVASSAITGDIGTSPITGAAIGVTCAEVTGNIYTVDATGPACRIQDENKLTVAVGDMQTAYTDAAGRTLPDFTELGAGDISGMTLVPGLYK
ncbi:MAG: hypothetical protein JWO89_3788, partial [Verrucomicrobiaceae bacterium]|nr:hypothetical protein [Verrucomicrobiaceae bacterium]